MIEGLRTGGDTDGTRPTRSPLGGLPRLSRSARWALVVGGLLSAAQAAALVTQAAALATTLARVVDAGTAGAAIPAVRGPLLVLALAIVLRAALGWATEAVSARAAAGAKEELRGTLLDGALHRGPEWIAERGAGQLTALATKGLDSLDAYFTQYLPALVTAAIVPPLIGAWILWSDPTSAVLIVITLPLIPLFAWLVGRYTESRTAKAADATARLSGHLLELVRALPVLSAFGRAGAQAAAVRRVSDAHRKATGATLRIAFLSALVLELFSSLSVALVAVGIGMRLVSGELDLTTGLLVLILAPECYLPLRAAGAAHHASEDGLEAVRRVEEVTGEARDPDPADEPAPVPGGTLRIADLRVARRGGHAPDGLNLTARPGEIVRLDEHGIGPSGSGKTSTFAVLLRFVEPSAGSVRLGDVEMADVDSREWRRRIAWVPQRPAFTGGTVAAELELAVTDLPARTVAAASEESLPEPDQAAATGSAADSHARSELRAVAERTSAAHLLDRRVDELSAGERQRVALARALLRAERGAELVLLDEPTAHLDARTAATAMSAVRDAARAGATVVLASHRADAATVEAAEPGPRLPSTSAEPTGRAPSPRRLLTRRTVAGALIGALSLLSGLALTATSAWLIARAAQQPPVLSLSVAAVGVRTFALSKAVLRYCERLVTHDAAFRLAGDLRERLWKSLARQGPVRTARLRRGDGAARLVDDVDAVRDLVPRVLTPPLIATVVATGAVALQATVLPSAGLLLAACLVIAGVCAPLVAVAIERRASRRLAAGRRDVASRVLGLLTSAGELLAFGAAGRRRAELAAADAGLARRSRRVATASGAATAVITLVLGVAVLGGAWLGARAVAAGELRPVFAPLLALVPLAAGEIVAMLPPAAQQWASLRDARARVEAVLADGCPPSSSPTSRRVRGHDATLGTAADHSTLDRRCGDGACPLHPDGDGERDPHGVYRGDGSGPPRPASDDSVTSGDLVLDTVDVGWPGAGELALRDVDLRLPAGTWVAVTGPSGAGKSTLLAALLGFLEPSRGRLQAPEGRSWCPQEPQLVSTTIRENLRLGDPHAGDDRMRATLRLAGLGDHADHLDTLVGTSGAALSGGQAQRLALARALLAAPQAGLLLLDEPTAHLDERTADEVLRGLRAEFDDGQLAGRVLVHVTHRASETAFADAAIHVDGGTVTVVDDTTDSRPGERHPSRLGH